MADNPLISYKSPVTRYLNRSVTGLLAPLEQLLTQRAVGGACRICFILGASRSGTSLLYELLATQFHCAYFSNFANRLYRAPVAATWLCRCEMRNRRGVVRQRLRRSRGARRAERGWPHSGYWTPYAAPHFLDRGGLSPAAIRAKVAAMRRIAGGRMIVKNPILQADFPLLRKLFPDAIFLHVKRIWSDNARSSVRAREDKTSTNGTGWVSLRPKRWEAFSRADPVMQSCAQVILSDAEIEQTLHGAGAQGRWMSIGYESHCRDPGSILRSVEVFFRDNGIHLARKDADLGNLTLSPRRQPNDDMKARILKSLEEISEGARG